MTKIPAPNEQSIAPTTKKKNYKHIYWIPPIHIITTSQMAAPKPEVDPHELAQYAARISEHLKELEASVDQWREYRDDYKQLGQLLSSLPDKTSYDIMVPIGKLAFMPGRLVHTNEILALLGDNWFADVSAKEAAGIVARRQEVVEENLKVVETQLNETNARAGAAPGVFKAEQYGLNEQGLPFMEIREELPDENVQSKGDQINVPNSVEAARNLKSSEKSKAEKLADQALLEKLKAMELEEEGEISDEDQEEEKKVVEDEDEDVDILSDDYDTEIADSMFDQFDDDEEYAMEGVVDREDYTYHDFQEEEDHETSDVEPMETITTPSVQQAIARATVEPPVTAPAPLVDTVKERLEESSPPIKDIKGKGKVKPIIKPRVSRFKQSIAQQREQPTTAEEKSPKKVSWGADVIHEHESSKQSQQTSTDEEESNIQQIPNEPIYNIRSPADIYHQLLDQRMAEQASQEQTNNEPVDVQSLLKDASVMKETIYMPSEHDIPQVTVSPKKKVSRFKQQRDQDRSSDNSSIASPSNHNNLRQTKLDTPTMRGAVVEKETEDVDLDEVEDNMLEKEVAAEYQKKRQNMIASQGGFSFANKPEFEVYDDDLPLPNRQPKNSDPSVEAEEKPKRVSKFKAAKLAAKTQQPQ
ncbi:hypothetical protein BGW37DRAFT_501056 [Umbelopsis sp. PMI_123]|nr:hypothetical protein BGW37DRAFT_501056 [Umbelopsis sp. PMI_123]